MTSNFKEKSQKKSNYYQFMYSCNTENYYSTQNLKALGNARAAISGSSKRFNFYYLISHKYREEDSQLKQSKKHEEVLHQQLSQH